MAAVFDAPVASIDGEELLGGCFVGLSAGDAVGEVVGVFSALFFNRFSLNQEGLLDVGKVEIEVECGGGPNFSSFDPTMIWGIIGNEIGFLSILEIQLDIFEEAGLVAFDGEVVMGLTLEAQIIGDLALGQESIGGNVFALDIDGIEQRDGHFDFIGALEFFIAFYGQRADFFWV